MLSCPPMLRFLLHLVSLDYAVWGKKSRKITRIVAVVKCLSNRGFLLSVFSALPPILRFLAVIRPFCQSGIGQPFSLHTRYQRLQPVNRVVLAISLVQPKRTLVDVELHVLDRKIVENPVKSPL